MMRRSLFAAIAALFSASTAYSQTIISSGSGPLVVGNGKDIKNTRMLSGTFTRVQVHGPLDVMVQQDDRRDPVTEVSVYADSNLHDVIETRLAGGTLIVKVKEGVSLRTNNPMSVSTFASRVVRAELRGSGSLVVRDFEQPEIDLEVIGSGDIIASGEVTSARMHVKGSGDIHARGLSAVRLDATVDGSGDIHAKAKSDARLRVNGSGDINLDGKPERQDARVFGSGDIRY